MSEFVNYQKRGFELPPGCKNLIDVLKPPPPPREASIPTEGLGQVERYLSRLLQPPMGSRSLWIDSFTLPVTIGLLLSKGQLKALIFFDMKHEESVRAILSKAEIPLTQEHAFGDPGLFTRVLMCSLPTDAATVGTIVSDLFLNGYGLPADAQLYFRYRERSG